MNGRVVVEELQQPKTEGFIAVTSEAPVKGVVVAASEDSKLRVGDTVLFSRESGIGVIVGDKPCVLLREQEIYARITEDKTN